MVAIDHFVEVATLMYKQGEVPLQVHPPIMNFTQLFVVQGEAFNK